MSILRPITPLDLPRLAGHAGDPRALLALANAGYRQYPRAWLIGVPTISFGYGAGFFTCHQCGSRQCAAANPLSDDITAKRAWLKIGLMWC